MKVLWRTLLLLALLLTVLLPAALYTVLFTDPGSRFLLREVERLVPVQIEYGSGSVSGRLQLSHVRYETADLRLELHDVVVELAPGCLWRGALCLRQLQAGNLDLALLPAVEEAPQSPAGDAQAAATEPVVFPLPVEIDALDIGSLHVQWSGGEWRQQKLRGQLHLYQSTVEVRDTRIDEPQLVLRDTDSATIEESGVAVLPAIDLPLTLSVDNLQLIKPTADFYGAAYQLDQISLRGQWSGNTLRLEPLAVSSSELGELSLSAELAFTDNWPLEAAAVIQLAEPLQYSDLLGSTLQLSARGDLSDLVLQLSADGAVAVAAEGRVDVLDPALPFSTTVSASADRGLTLARIGNVPELVQDVEVEFPLKLSASGSLHAQQFELTGAASGLGYKSLRLSMVGGHDGEKLAITDLSMLDAAGANGLRAQGDIMLSAQRSWSLSLQTSGLDLPAINDSVRGRIDGSIDLAGALPDERWEVRVTDVALQGEVNDISATVRGFTGLDSDLRVSSSALQAQVNGAQLSLQSPGDAIGPGQLQVKVDDIGRWQAGSSGSLELDAEVSPDRQRIAFSGRLQKVVWEGQRFEQAIFTGDYRQADGHAFTLDTTVSEAVFADLSFRELHLRARGDAQQQSLSLASRGDIQGELNISGTTQGDQWQGALAATRLQTPMGEWVLANAVPMRGSLGARQLTLDGHCWQQQHAQLCPGVWSLGTQGSGSLQFDADLQMLADLLPPDVELTGAVQLQLDAQWSPDAAARVTGNARTGAVTITQHFDDGQSAAYQWDDANVALDYSSAGLQLAASVQQGSRNIVGLDLLLQSDRSAAIAGSLNVDRLQLAAFAPFVPALSTLAGELGGSVSLAGTIDKPQAFGEFTLTAGQLSVQENPTQLENLQVNLKLQGTAAEIHGAGVLGGGDLQLLGRVDIDPALRLELQVSGGEHTILYPPTTELQIAQALKIVVQQGLLELTGEVTVLDGRLEIEALPEGSVAISPSVVEVDSDGGVLREELPFDMRINVQIHIADQFTVAGDSLQTRLGGELSVQQQPGKPLQIFGNLDTVGGEFRAYQARLQIKRGTISFVGPPTNPNLDVRAERHISSGDITVGVRVQGPLEDDLQLELYSDPAMSQADTMSYLIRGRGMDAGAGLDGTSAALSLASGVVNRSELVTELNRIPGLSNVEFGAQGSQADTAATVSGYLGERIYLSYGVGLYEPVNVLTARFYFRSRLWLEVVSSIENSLDLYYSFDID